MGISNLNLVNIALFLRWWWKAYHETNSLWSITIYALRAKRSNRPGPRIWNVTGSFFWGQLQSLYTLFTLCTAWHIGDGRSISYWYDTWDERTRATKRVSAQHRSLLSLREAWQLGFTNNQEETRDLNLPLLGDGLDRIVWKLEKTNTYTTKSAYRILSQVGKIKWRFRRIWRSKVPSTVRIFLFLMIQGKILTKQVLRRRGLMVPMRCVLCNNCMVETALHLLFKCPYARRVWEDMERIRNIRLLKVASSVQDIWDQSCQKVREQGQIPVSTWMTVFGCVLWAIWKQRNTVVFREQGIPPSMLATRCAEEIELWLTYC